jgi:hypothetical protein
MRSVNVASGGRSVPYTSNSARASFATFACSWACSWP